MGLTRHSGYGLALGACVLVLSAWSLLASHHLPPGFERISGDHWYRLELNGEHAGWARLSARRSPQGYRLSNEFALLQHDGHAPYLTRWQTEEQYSRHFPWSLLERIAVTRRHGNRKRQRLTQIAPGIYEHRSENAHSTHQFEARYQLGDRLRMQSSPLVPGSQFNIQTIDSDTGLPQLTQWHVQPGDPSGRRELRDASGDRRVLLDDNQRLQRLELGAGMRITRSTEERARRTVLPAARSPLTIAINQPLGVPETLQRLRIRVLGADLDSFANTAQQQVSGSSGAFEIDVRQHAPDELSVSTGGDNSVLPMDTHSPQQVGELARKPVPRSPQAHGDPR